ncbi:MAG: HAD family hydrolase [Lachnospiraceae bacterium]|nr:HAD family hydrolase [Lachnospiraceae bacterium]
MTGDMMYGTILFDLDGTLLPMVMEEFTNGYFKFLTAKMAAHGYDPKQLIDAIWKGTYAMVKNDRERTNEEVFWECFRGIYGEKALSDSRYFNDFYDHEFNDAAVFCGYNELAGECVRKLKETGHKVILATNPFFPIFAQKHRCRWAGVDPDDFAYISSYENSHYCKPNPKYYLELIEKLSLDPRDCLMVGNDAEEDLAAEEAGLKVFLLTDCLINTKQKDIAGYPKGGFPELMQYLQLTE